MKLEVEPQTLAFAAAGLATVGMFASVHALGGEVGNAGEVVAALGGVGAFLAALALYRREADRDEERAADARRQQATLVSAWAIGRLRTGSTKAADGSQVPKFSATVMVRNGSSEPVYNVRVFVRTSYAPDAEAVSSELIVVLPPEETREEVVTRRGLEVEDLAGPPYVEVRFKDARGQRWYRRYEGGLGPDPGPDL